MTTSQPIRRCDSNGILKKSSSDIGTSQRQQQQEQRSVFFESETKCFVVPTRHDYSEDERCEAWFQDHEYSLIKENNKILLKMMIQEGGHKEDDRHCFRGLEFKTVEARKRRRESKFAAAFAVFSEQERQWQEGQMRSIDFDLIGEVYAEMTADAQMRAHENGLKDASYADDHDEEVDSMTSDDESCENQYARDSLTSKDAESRWNPSEAKKTSCVGTTQTSHRWSLSSLLLKKRRRQ